MRRSAMRDRYRMPRVAVPIAHKPPKQMRDTQWVADNGQWAGSEQVQSMGS
jgi:hypothetical protein